MRLVAVDVGRPIVFLSMNRPNDSGRTKMEDKSLSDSNFWHAHVGSSWSQCMLERGSRLSTNLVAASANFGTADSFCPPRVEKAEGGRGIRKSCLRRSRGGLRQAVVQMGCGSAAPGSVAGQNLVNSAATISPIEP